jgi:hypothetical protein
VSNVLVIMVVLGDIYESTSRQATKRTAVASAVEVDTLTTQLLVTDGALLLSQLGSHVNRVFYKSLEATVLVNITEANVAASSLRVHMPRKSNLASNTGKSPSPSTNVEHLAQHLMIGDGRCIGR